MVVLNYFKSTIISNLITYLTIYFVFINNELEVQRNLKFVVKFSHEFIFTNFHSDEYCDRQYSTLGNFLGLDATVLLLKWNNIKTNDQVVWPALFEIIENKVHKLVQKLFVFENF